MDEAGGMDTIVNTATSRNMWAIMREFKILPTNPDFQAMTDSQMGFVMANMNKDAEISNMLAKGLDPSKHVKDSDNTWWDTPIDEFNPKGNLELSDEDIAEQLEEMTTQKDRKRLAKVSQGNQEWADYLEKEGNASEQLNTERIIQDKLKIALDEAKMLENSGASNWGKPRVTEEEEEKAAEFEPMTQEGIDEAFRLFEGEDDEEESGPDDGWI